MPTTAIATAVQRPAVLLPLVSLGLLLLLVYYAATAPAAAATMRTYASPAARRRGIML